MAEWRDFHTGTFRERKPGEGLLLPGREPYISPSFVRLAFRDLVWQIAEWQGEKRPRRWRAPGRDPRTVAWVLAIEEHPLRWRANHAHALIAHQGFVRRESVRAWWQERYGWARTLPVHENAGMYVGKYLSKGGRLEFSANLTRQKWTAPPGG